MISVIIPVYNVEKYLKDCLESVVHQSFIDKEVLLIDDGSTDSSPAICEDYAARYSYIRVIHKENGGLSSARNKGIDEACGDWVIFLDSDDVWSDKNCLSKLHRYATSLNLDILRFEYQAVNENLEPIGPRDRDKSNIENKLTDNYNLVRYGIAGEWFAWLYLIKRYTITGIRFNEKTKFQEDIDFYCRLFAEKKLRCGYLNEKMYLYRKRSSSITTTCRIGNLKGSFDLCDIFYDSSLRTKNKKLGALYRNYSVMMYYWTLQSLAAEPYYTDRVSIIEDLHLDVLHKRVLTRIKETSINLKYKIFIYPYPSIGTKILHFKDLMRSLMK